MAIPTDTPTTVEVWAELRAHLLAFVRGRVRSEHDAEDLLQEVFLKIHGSLDKLHARASLTAFVFQVARNAVIDFYRRKNLRRRSRRTWSRSRRTRARAPTSRRASDRS